MQGHPKQLQTEESAMRQKIAPKNMQTFIGRYYTSDGFYGDDYRYYTRNVHLHDDKSGSLLSKEDFLLGLGLGLLTALAAFHLYHLGQMKHQYPHHHNTHYGGSGYGDQNSSSKRAVPAKVHSHRHSDYGHQSLLVDHNSCVGGCPNHAS